MTYAIGFIGCQSSIVAARIGKCLKAKRTLNLIQQVWLLFNQIRVIWLSIIHKGQACRIMRYYQKELGISCLRTLTLCSSHALKEDEE
jgi:hypothetical protein